MNWRKLYNKDFLNENLKDPSLADGFLKQAVKRARKTAIILGSVLVVAEIAVVYGFVAQTKAREVVIQVEIKKTEFDNCIKEAETQQALAIEAQLIAEEANKMAEQQLKECWQRNGK